MILSSSRFLCTVTLALGFAATALASSAEPWSDDLEQRGNEILEAYQHAARDAFDDPEGYEAREYVDGLPERRSAEESVEKLAARARAYRRSIDSHGYPHDSWRQQPFGNGRRGVRLTERDLEVEEGLERRSIFPHDTAVISRLRKRIKSGHEASEARKARRRARKAAKAKAKAEAAEKEQQEELEARQAQRILRQFERREAEERLARRAAVTQKTFDRIIYAARQLVDEEEALAAREYEEELAAREFEELAVKARELADEEALAARSVAEEPGVEARETVAETPVEARSPADASEAIVLEAREQEPKVEAREIVAETPVEARSPADVLEANVLESREPAKEETPVAREIVAPPAEEPTKRDVNVQEEQLQGREPVDGEAPTARNVDSAETPTKREVTVTEEELKAREPEPAPAPVPEPAEGAKPLEARSDAAAPEVGEAVAKRSDSETVLTPRSEEPAAVN